MKDEYISVIGESYLDPIVKLFEELPEKSSYNSVQTSPHENGYSVSIIVLSAVMLESFLSRTRYIKQKENTSENLRSVLKFIEENLSLPEKMISVLYELFVLRDIIVHNHIWEGEIAQIPLRFKNEPTLDRELFGDKKFSEYVNLMKRKTKSLGLNIFPTKICKEDAIIYFENVYKVLLEIEEISRQYVYFSHHHVHYQNSFLTLEEFIAVIKK